MPAAIGSSAPARATDSPSSNTNFLPLRSCTSPIGTESNPNMRKPVSGTNCAVKLDTWKVSLTNVTKGPTTSPKPIARKTKNTGHARFIRFSQIARYSLPLIVNESPYYTKKTSRRTPGGFFISVIGWWQGDASSVRVWRDA
ncbi:MAG: hypothetical protein BWX70_03337 [Verrucomicrobia bacterium ADurb.Bin070]|nr:MAG: hypothetical protein BWX70_03337 [Verrucomicrobia bacterium ADurb.Bin070]